MKKIGILSAFLLVLLWISCEKENKSDDDNGSSDTTETADTIAHESEDDYVYDTNAIVEITLLNTSVSCNNAAVTIDGTKLTIHHAGVYRITGTLNDGRIIVNSEDEASVKMIFNDMTVNCSNSSPVSIMKSWKTIIQLADNSVNTLTDGSTYTYDDTEKQEPNAVIFSKSDLTLYGSGSLFIDGNFKDGISSKDGLIINSGIYKVDAVDNGIRGKDYLIIKDGIFDVTAGSNGLKSDNDNSVDLGYIAIENGKYTIISAGDGITAQTLLQITGGSYNLVTGGGSSKIAGSTVSSKGVKGLISVSIACDTMIINSSDDAIHSNYSVNITKGFLSLYSADDGVHADETIKISDCTLSILKSYEGIESFSITLENSNLRVYASDDAINSTRGSRTEQDDNSNLFINSGYLYVNTSSGDGLDSNGSITISGGTVIVHGPSSTVNVGLDYNGTCKITGGILVLSGPNSNMVQTPSSSSTQNTVLVKLSTNLNANTLFHIERNDGTDILTFAPEHNYQSVLFSSPVLVNDSYTVQTGGSSSGTITDGLYDNGEYSPGSDFKTFTVSSVITTVGSTGGGGFRP